MRGVAKFFYRKQVRNGRNTSFWYDRMSERGVLSDLLGERGVIDMGIRKDATVEEAILCSHRRRRHCTCTVLLKDIEVDLSRMRDCLSQTEEDISLWRKDSRFKNQFSAQKTWQLIRETKAKCSWSRGIWFSQATPKFSFMMWLATLDRRSTMDRILCWNPSIDATCVLCKNAPEFRDHLFFECSYSFQVWEHLIKGMLRNSYTNIWSGIMLLISDRKKEKKKLFCIRYALQSAMYVLWRERNKVKHREKLMPKVVLKKMLDKDIRNKLSLLRSKRVKGMEGALQFWFVTRA